jgi:hypothetical protein
MVISASLDGIGAALAGTWIVTVGPLPDGVTVRSGSDGCAQKKGCAKAPSVSIIPGPACAAASAMYAPDWLSIGAPAGIGVLK